MSMFIVHQAANYTLLLADSLARRTVESTSDTVSTSASKLVQVSAGVFAAHAGTWQPAIAMLSDVAALIAKRTSRSLSHKTLCASLAKIGTKRYAEFQALWKDHTIDVRIALVLTGNLRDSIDVKEGFSSTVLLWEAARGFKPIRVRGKLCFASNHKLSLFASDLLGHAALKELVESSPLSAAQALLATHAAAAHISDSISAQPNLVLIGDDQKSCALHGRILSLPCAALLQG